MPIGWQKRGHPRVRVVYGGFNAWKAVHGDPSKHQEVVNSPPVPTASTSTDNAAQ